MVFHNRLSDLLLTLVVQVVQVVHMVQVQRDVTTVNASVLIIVIIIV